MSVSPRAVSDQGLSPALTGHGSRVLEINYRSLAGQLASLVESIKAMPSGARTDLASIDARSDADAAALLNVAERSVE